MKRWTVFSFLAASVIAVAGLCGTALAQPGGGGTVPKEWAWEHCYEQGYDHEHEIEVTFKWTDNNHPYSMSCCDPRHHVMIYTWDYGGIASFDHEHGILNYDGTSDNPTTDASGTYHADLGPYREDLEDDWDSWMSWVATPPVGYGDVCKVVAEVSLKSGTTVSLWSKELRLLYNDPPSIVWNGVVQPDNAYTVQINVDDGDTVVKISGYEWCATDRGCGNKNWNIFLYYDDTDPRGNGDWANKHVAETVLDDNVIGPGPSTDYSEGWRFVSTSEHLLLGQYADANDDFQARLVIVDEDGTVRAYSEVRTIHGHAL